MSGGPFAGLADRRCWLTWRNEPVKGQPDKLTKMPHAPGGGPGKSTDPKTWGTRAAAEDRAKQLVNNLGGGIAIVLGIETAAEKQLGGIDLDTCAADGTLEEWALEVIARFGSYTEISPSGTGAKIFFEYRTADLARLKPLLGDRFGCNFKRPGNGGGHPPAIEFYLGRRYFCVTEDVLDEGLSELRLVDFADLEWLFHTAGPAFVGNGAAHRQGGHTADLSRSGVAFRKGLALRNAGASFAEMCEALAGDTETAEWCAEKGEPHDRRELRRIWDKAAEAPIGISVEDFVAYMPQHRYFYLPTRETWPAASINARIAPTAVLGPDGAAVLDDKGAPVKVAASVWLDRHKPVEQMTWAPGLAAIVHDRIMRDGGWVPHQGARCFNFYRAPAIMPGDAGAAGPWRRHLEYVFPEEAEHIALWLAHRVQRPGEKINHALVLGGDHGIGKDTMLAPVRRAVGEWNWQDIGPPHLSGAFTGFLKAVVLRISEAHDLGEFSRFGFYESLKRLTAAPPEVLRINEKFLPEYYIPNVCGVVITTNHLAGGMYLPGEDRRHHVSWSPRQRADFPEGYWSEHWGWLNSGGDRHVAAYLASLDLGGFDPKAPPPKTEAFYAIVNAGRAPEEAEIADALDELGKLPGGAARRGDPTRPDAVTLDDIRRSAGAVSDAFADWADDRKNQRAIPHRLEACGYTSQRNPDAPEDGYWRIGQKRVAIYVKVELPAAERLATARRYGSVSHVTQKGCDHFHRFHRSYRPDTRLAFVHFHRHHRHHRFLGCPVGLIGLIGNPPIYPHPAFFYSSLHVRILCDFLRVGRIRW